MRCSILVPSLGRARYLEEVTSNIHEATPEDHRILFCIGDDESRGILDRLGEWYLWDGDCEDKRYVTRMNKLVLYTDDDDQDMFFGSDDVVHHPGWLPAARKVQAAGFGCVVVNDMRNPSGTQALMHRGYLRRACFDDPDAAFHHGYKHNFADTEQFVTARMQGHLARAMDSIVEHLHPNYRESHRSRPVDQTYADAQRWWNEDAALFESRMRRLVVIYG